MTTTTCPRTNPPPGGLCEAPSRAGLHRPSCILKKNGCLASPIAGEQGRDFLLPVLRCTDDDAFARISRSSNSTRPRLRSRLPGEFLRPELYGLNEPKHGDSTTGWVRNVSGNNPEYTEFTSTSFFEIRRIPDYFKKEKPQFGEDEPFWTTRQVHSRLPCQSGFDTMRLRVALWQQAFISPYRDCDGCAGNSCLRFLCVFRRGSLTGIAVAISVALAYWVVDGLFSAMGNVELFARGACGVVSRRSLSASQAVCLLLRTPT